MKERFCSRYLEILILKFNFNKRVRYCRVFRISSVKEDCQFFKEKISKAEVNSILLDSVQLDTIVLESAAQMSF
jgi:hypothetical protein